MYVCITYISCIHNCVIIRRFKGYNIGIEKCKCDGWWYCSVLLIIMLSCMAEPYSFMLCLSIDR